MRLESEMTAFEGEQYLLVDVECYGCDRLVAMSYSSLVDGRRFCNRCTNDYNCPTCGKSTKICGLRDKLSMQEAHISGMCQECQNGVFDK